jgi:citrate synthase
VLRKLSKQVGEHVGETKWYEMSLEVEEVVKAEKGLYPNVDFFAASVYYGLGIPVDLFTPVFAASRIAGWTAHVREQYADNRLIRPESDYIGPSNQRYVPIDQRG